MNELNQLTEKQIQKMMKIAKETRKYAFTYRTMHKLGASVMTGDGKIIGGCNIESAISGLGTCAERCAIDNAICQGEYDIVAICTVDSKITPCCGACLQYMMIFSQIFERDLYVVNCDNKGHYRVNLLSELLPDGYKTSANLAPIKKQILKIIHKKHK